MLPYKYIIIIHTLPLSLGKISDKVLTMNIKKWICQHWTLCRQWYRLENNTVLLLLKLSKHVLMTRGMLYSILLQLEKKNPIKQLTKWSSTTVDATLSLVQLTGTVTTTLQRLTTFYSSLSSHPALHATLFSYFFTQPQAARQYEPRSLKLLQPRSI